MWKCNDASVWACVGIVTCATAWLFTKSSTLRIKDRHSLYYLTDFARDAEHREDKYVQLVEYTVKFMYKLVESIYLFDAHACNQIVFEAEQYAQKHGWTTKRHEQYPTTDIPLSELTFSYARVMNAVYLKVFPKIEELFHFPMDSLYVHDLFVVRYTHDRQQQLATHRDGSLFSFILVLNDDFEGGGTRINKRVVKPAVGHAMVFCGQNLHQGMPIHSGVRYIVTGFVNHYPVDKC
jgi:hypothetical protein